MMPKSELSALLATLEGVVFDVDGVLTDGRITYTDDGHEIKSFHVQDGASIKLLQEHGLTVAIITGRRSPIVARRARELGVDHIVQGAASKAAALDQLIESGFPAGANAAVGDDIQDIEMFNHTSVLVSITVPNAHPTVLDQAHWTTQRAGGEGIVAEIAERILKSQDKWPY